MLTAEPSSEAEFSQAKRLSFFTLAREVCDTPAMHRILSLVRMWGCRTLVKESLDLSSTQMSLEQDAIEKMESLSAKVAGRKARTLAGLDGTRLSFFRVPFSSFPCGRTEAEESFLASIVILGLQWECGERQRFIYDAAIHIPDVVLGTSCPYGRRAPAACEHARGPLGQHFVHSEVSVELRVSDLQFQRPSTYFCESIPANGFTCVHAALRMVLRHELRACTFAEAERVVGQFRSDPHYTTDREVEQALCWWDLATTRIDCTKVAKGNESYAEALHSMVEPGHCALLAFSCHNPKRSGKSQPVEHVGVVVGHTMNYHAWHPLGLVAYGDSRELPLGLPTYWWADCFVAHDNNLGPLLQMRQDVLEKSGPTFLTSHIQALSITGIRPKAAATPAPVAQTAAFGIVEAVVLAAGDKFAYRWFQELHAVLTQTRLQKRGESFSGRVSLATKRTTLITRDDYLIHLQVAKDARGRRMGAETVEHVRQALPPGQYWMTEISDPDLLTGNGAKYGECLIEATAHPEAISLDDAHAEDLWEVPHIVRLPGLLFLPAPSEPYKYLVEEHGAHSYTPLYSRPYAGE